MIGYLPNGFGREAPSRIAPLEGEALKLEMKRVTSTGLGGRAVEGINEETGEDFFLPPVRFINKNKHI